MSLWRQLARGFRSLARRSAADEEVDDEVRHYFEQLVAAHLGRGLSPAAAARAARLEAGNPALVREQVRESGWESGVRTVLADLRFGARQLRANPGFTAVTTLILALGIGATTAIFSTVSPILLESLPYPHPDRIVAIWEVGGDGSPNATSYGMYRALAERSRSAAALAVLKAWQPTMTGAGQPERFDGQRVSAGYFRVLSVAPLAGRDFQAADDRPGGSNVVILSERLWRRRFGADRAIVGRRIALDEASGPAAGDRYTVIGVMPRGFENVLAPSAEIWAPLQYDLSQGRAWGHHLRLAGRLREGVGQEQAVREFDDLGRQALRELHPETYGATVEFAVRALQDEVTRGVRPALLAIFGAVVLVLLIACVNVTNLLLARGVLRRGEIALRTALGAPRRRLVGQLLTENLLLAALGGAAGMAVAMLGVRAIVALGPAELPRAGAIGLHGAVLAFGWAVTALIGLAFGLTPALHATRPDLRRDLGQGSPRATGRHRRVRGALAVAEVALALVLLVSSGLLLRSLRRLFAVPVGFAASHVVTMQVEAVGHRYDDDAARQRFFARALAAVERVPGVASAAFTSQLPLSGDADTYGVTFEKDHDPRAGSEVFRYAVTPGYFQAIGIPLRRGRLLEERDRAGAPRVALINESLARRKLGDGRDPIGQRIHIGPPDAWYTIAGVVGDVRQTSLALGAPDAAYTTAAQWLWGDPVMSLVARGRGDAAALAPALRRAIWSVDKDQPVVRVATMDELLAASLAQRRFALDLFAAFALLALALAAAGIFGVLAGSVAERTREIGVRSALGASRRSILAMVIGQGMALTGAGVAIGLAGAAAASRALAAMLFGVSGLDPATYLGVVALLAAVALIACGVPAWRALRVDPATSLRTE